MADHTFFTDQVVFKSEKGIEGKKYYVEGYASTSDLDLVNDVCTPSCLADMKEQIVGKSIKVDIDHETVSQDRLELVPVAKIVDARIDKKGLWIKAELNSSTGRFGEVWGSIKGGFLDAFSITFKAVKAVKKAMDGKMVRLLDKVDLINVALTGNPVNRAATITNVVVKSLKHLEDSTMTEQEKNVPEAEAKAEEAPAPAAEPEEAPAAEAEAESPAAEAATEAAPAPEAEAKSELEALKQEIKSLKEVVDGLKAEPVKEEEEEEDEEKGCGKKMSYDKKSFDELAQKVEKLEAENKALNELLDKPLHKGAEMKSNNDAVQRRGTLQFL